MKTHNHHSAVHWTKIISLGVLFIGLMSGPRSTAQTAASYHNEADAALQSFLLKFWNGGQQYLNNVYPANGSLSAYWTFAHGWDAVMDGVERTGGQQYYGLIDTLYLGQNQRGWMSSYYDDECWMTMALIHAYDLTSNTKYLTEAQNLYADIQNGWDTSCCGAAPGGVWWDKAHTQKATASNGGAALAGARLYRRTGNLSYLNFAQQVYSYWYPHMVNQTTYQVADHIDTTGTITWWRFTYNEGDMIGAAVELNAATGNASYLTDANNIAGFMISNEVVSTTYGSVLYDGDNTGCGGDCHEFKGPGYRNLMLLYAQNTNQTRYYNVLKSSADAIWNLANDPSLTIFAVNWAGPYQTNVDELQDNAACIALSRFAQQYGPYPGSGIPAGQFEAENGVIHNISLEATYAGFTGWGYLAGWNANGQSVDFNLNFASAGTYTLTFRYAAGAGNASRLISINGVNAFPNQSFPNTGSWGSYSTVSVSYSLPAGLNTISVAFNSSLGNANYLNLDNMTVSSGGGSPPPAPSGLTAKAARQSGKINLSWTGSSGATSYNVKRATVSGGPYGNIATGVTTTSYTDSGLTSGTTYYYVVSAVNSVGESPNSNQASATAK